MDDKDPGWNQITSDFERSFALLNHLPCDIFLASHGSFFYFVEKHERLLHGDVNAFIDPAGYKTYLRESEQEFRSKLAQQKAPVPDAATMTSTNPAHVYKVRPRKDHRGVDVISDALPFGRLSYAGPNAVSNAVDYTKFRSRSRDAVISVIPSDAICEQK